MTDNGERRINLHIPSDADLKCGDIEAIYPFVKEYYPEYDGCEIVCDPWLLSAELKKLLSEDTTLQRAMKKHLEAGRKVGSAYGVYVRR